MDQAFLERQKANLLRERDRVEKELDLVSEGGEARYEDMGSDEESNALEVAEFEENIAATSQFTGVLKDINDALERIDQGAYGTCEICACEIPRDRLEIFPAARICVKCTDICEKGE